jgi:hypothetical protein
MRATADPVTTRPASTGSTTTKRLIDIKRDPQLKTGYA